MAKESSRAVPPVVETANDRFKRRYGGWLWGSLSTATLLHFAVFAFWPALTTANLASVREELRAIEIPPDIVLPPPPEEIVRPVSPVMSADITIDDEITIPRFSEVHTLPELPPVRGGADTEAQGPTFTPRTVEPELRNRAAVGRALERSYPPLLRDAGLGGTTTVWFLIDEEGRVLRTQLDRTSGHEQLDRAALDVARVMQFRPALNHGRPVPVWVSIPIVFQAR